MACLLFVQVSFCELCEGMKVTAGYLNNTCPLSGGIMVVSVYAGFRLWLSETTLGGTKKNENGREIGCAGYEKLPGLGVLL